MHTFVAIALRFFFIYYFKIYYPKLRLRGNVKEMNIFLLVCEIQPEEHIYLIE